MFIENGLKTAVIEIDRQVVPAAGHSPGEGPESDPEPLWGG